MRYLLNFSYNGRNYNGYQRQDNGHSIEEVIEDILTELMNEKIIIYASGRTDKGVHALNQYAHFDAVRELECETLKYKINKILPSDIYIRNVTLVNEEFHARYSATSKTYLYKINIGPHNPFEDQLFYDYIDPLDMEKLTKVKMLFEGKHCFKNFTSKRIDNFDFIRNIEQIKIINAGDKIFISFRGDGFMRYEIRMLVANMLAYASGKISFESIEELLESNKRHITCRCAPGYGLYLYEVNYDEI
ncbi:MAG: tRNA pseudouridine(38-40) synthase TruA [Bacilli bacterium]